MVKNALGEFRLHETPQSQQAVPGQVKNSAGGYVFTVDPMTGVERFVILGTEKGTYYTDQQKLTRDNALAVLELAKTRGVEVVQKVVEISEGGRAPKNDQAVFVMALLSVEGNLETRQAVYDAIGNHKVARTATHLAQFLEFRQQLSRTKGWSHGLRKAISRWYMNRTPEQAAYQIAKYPQRGGRKHGDTLRQAHPKTGTFEPTGLNGVFRWAVGKEVGGAGLPDIVTGVTMAKGALDAAHTARLVRQYGLTWEMVKTEHLNERAVWEALLEEDKVGITALIRQLPRLTNIGLLADKTWRDAITARLVDPVLLRKGRVHPINVLVAMRTYASGHGERSSNTWQPVRQVVDALDAGFYAAFETVEPSGKRRCIALDVSGSMGSPVAGLPLNCREASGAMAMVTIAREPDTYVVGFTGGGMHSLRYGGGFYSGYGSRVPQNTRSVDDLTVLDLSARRRLDDNIRHITGLPFGGTDCALPMLHASAKGLKFDSFEVYTDNETWAGSIHPFEALQQYRADSGIPDAALVVNGMTATDFTIANPTDPRMLDVVGLDAAAPGLINDFVAGRI
jgi:60 kDa SS-A/Ro ribonucleoprotein